MPDAPTNLLSLGTSRMAYTSSKGSEMGTAGREPTVEGVTCGLGNLRSGQETE